MVATSSGQSPRIPDKVGVDGLEGKWVPVWEDNGTFLFDRNKTREDVYSIDTPPPTVSGSLHIGHVFSYTHTDVLARYQRMRGREVFYPMGWDDNGLPTERRVQNYYGVRCEPSLPYDPYFQPPELPGKKIISCSRQNFIELCERLTKIDEKVFEELWRRLGLSVDWSMTYQTINRNARVISQRAFLRNLARNEAYQAEAPTLWDVTFRTAVAQAELEDREWPAAFHDIAFTDQAGNDVVIATTRPELLPACVALVAHPDDERFQSLFGQKVRSPLFDVEVPVLAHHLADPAKGHGIAMVCTFGDVTDVIWWRELKLDTRSVLGKDGRFADTIPHGIQGTAGINAYQRLVGKTAHTGRQFIIDMLRETGALIGEPRSITHSVKFYEKGDKPLEIVASRQWYISNGGRNDDLRETLLARGKELRWVPEHMNVRYSNWVSGLSSDWLISRQRFFGVPIPVWYAVDSDGNPDYTTVLTPSEDNLPVDPSVDTPEGYTEVQRNQPNGFIGEADVMDTWATSSLTPQIAGQWGIDDDLFERVFPMDLRPQAHEIIRTWLFSTIVRAELEYHVLPWASASISGWVLDPDRKKMSKSKGNVITPMGLLEKHGSDAVRYWAASARPGTDTAVDEGQMKVGRRLATKLLNVSRFVLGLGLPHDTALSSEPLDLALLAELSSVITHATHALEKLDYGRALQVIESFFWIFCDDYVELVKNRAYSEGDLAESAKRTLTNALSALLRLFAPFLPFTTEEVWSWWQNGSIHRANWPSATEFTVTDGAAELLSIASHVISSIRKAKSEATISMRAAVDSIMVSGSEAAIELFDKVKEDIRSAGNVTNIATTVVPDQELMTEVTISQVQ